MSERARLAHVDYVRLAGLEGCSLYFERLLQNGFDAWPLSLRLDYPSLSDWQGVPELKRSLRQPVGLPESSPVLLANRTAELIRLATRLLCARCTRVLVCDLGWPSYRRILEQARISSRVGVTTVSLRSAIFGKQFTKTEIIDRIVSHYARMSCDGIFLPAVSHEGVRLQVDTICDAISRRVGRPRFIVVDGAQAFCHVPDELGLEHCDFFLSGSHKWLQGHVPMGIGFLPNEDFASKILAAAHRMIIGNELDDPLLTFIRQLEGDVLEMFSETVSLSSLFSCRAAIAERESAGMSVARQFEQRRRNAVKLLNAIDGIGWVAKTMASELSSGIVLLQVVDPKLRGASSGLVREFFLTQGISLTCYDDGLVRLSMSDRPWRNEELNMLTQALASFARQSGPPLELNHGCDQESGDEWRPTDSNRALASSPIL